MQVFAFVGSLSLARFWMLCDWTDGGPKEIIFCVRFPLFLQLLNAGVRPSRGEERGIVSPTLEHGEMKWPLLRSLFPSAASLRFNKL